MNIDQSIINELARIATCIDQDNVRESDARYLWNLIKKAERDLAPGFKSGDDPVKSLPQSVQDGMSDSDKDKFRGHIKAKDKIAALKLVRVIDGGTLSDAKAMVDVILPAPTFLRS